MNRCALGLDYGTESVRALVVDCMTGAEIAQAVHAYEHGVVTGTLPAGAVSEEFAAETGLKAGTPVSAAMIDAHCGVPGMGVAEPGPLCIIMGTSVCHLLSSPELRFFKGVTGIVKDGILPGSYGYEAGQAAGGDLFGWFVKDFMGLPFEEITAPSQFAGRSSM